MPTFRYEGYAFRFYSSDGVEPAHIHVLRGASEAKIWLSPMALQHTHGYTQSQIREVLKICAEHREEFLEAWHEYFARLEF